MAVSVVRPVQVEEVAVTRELADHPVLGDRNRHPSRDVLPPQLLDRVELERLDQLVAADGRQRREHVAGPVQEPHRHDVGVGVVVDAGFACARIARRVLVGTHDAADPVPVGGRVVDGDVGEEPRDLEHHLGAVVGEELQIAGGLVVLPDAVGHGETDVALKVEVSESQCPDCGLRCARWLSSRPSLPDCQGTWPRDVRPRGPRVGRRPGHAPGTAAASGRGWASAA